MTSAVEDVSDLPGKKVHDQMGQEIGKVKEIYAHGGDGDATWVTVEAKGGGLGSKQTVFIPLARMKQEGDHIGVPYSTSHVENCPEIENEDELSEQDERNLRDHYGIDRADQELRSDNNSYATLMPDEEGTASRVEDTDQLETPNADKRDEETDKRLRDPGSSEIRHVSFGDDGESSGERPEESDEKEGSGEKHKAEDSGGEKEGSGEKKAEGSDSE